MVKVKGILEIDAYRGVIYFTETPPKNASKLRPKRLFQLRICQLPKPIPRNGMIDITVGHGASYTD